MGRSYARFFLPQTPAAVLGAANAYGLSVRMHPDSGSANHVTFIKGSVWVTGKRVPTVGAWEAQGGANVQIEAYVESLTELNADPRPVVGMIPRRDIWRIASGLVARFGMNPESMFVYT